MMSQRTRLIISTPSKLTCWWYFDKKFSTGILHACFQYTDLNNGAYKLTDIKLLHLTPQNDATLVIAVHFADTNACNEDKFQMHKSHQKNRIAAPIGVHGVRNLTSASQGFSLVIPGYYCLRL